MTFSNRIRIQHVDGHHAAPGADTLCRHLAPASRSSPKVHHARAGFQDMVLVIDLGELERGARPKSLALGAHHIRIVELALQPKRGRKRALLGGLDPHLQRALAPPAFFAARRHGCGSRG
jgi:hypothetical protein